MDNDEEFRRRPAGFGAVKRAARSVIKRLFRVLKVRNKIFFETEGDFCDNGRVLYEYLVKNGCTKKYRIVWKIKGQCPVRKVPENVCFISPKTFWNRLRLEYYMATAKYFFFTHPWELTEWKKTQTVVNLWHGTPIKGTGSDISRFFDYICVSSEDTRELFSRFTGAGNEQFLILGTPRLDLLFNKNEPLEESLSFLVKYRKTIICMPTFRRTANRSDSTFENVYSINAVKTPEELSALNEHLKKRETLLLVKVHHLQDLSFISETEMSNIIYLKDDDLLRMDVQLYELIAHTDAMLTDYSSVLFDYLLMDRPIGFFVGDIEEYNRGFIIDDPMSVMPGEKLRTLNELYDFIDNVAENRDNFRDERRQLLNKADKFQDGGNCRRIAEYFGLL